MGAQLSELEPWMQPAARELVSAMLRYYPVRVTSVYRSYTEQLELWRRRETNRFPVAPPGHSLHQYRRAFDVTGPPELLAAAGALWRSWGGGWSARDPIHFEVRT